MDKKLIFHPLYSLLDTVGVSLNLTGLRMILTYRTMAASMTYFLSSLTCFTTSADSTIVSSLIGNFNLVKVDRKKSLKDVVVVGMFSSGREHPLGVDSGPASRPSSGGVDSAPNAPAFSLPFEFHKAKLK